MKHDLELVISTGDPEGIGPEVSVAASKWMVAFDPRVRCVLVGGADVLARAGLDLATPDADSPGVGLRALRLAEVGELGRGPSASGGRAALLTFEAAVQRVALAPERALVTAPVSKEAITRSGRRFTGHTTALGERFGVDDPLMLFVAGRLRVALATVHVALRDVASTLTVERLLHKLQVLDRGLRDNFGLDSRRIAVLALNPHAGEGGLLGDEESRILRPAMVDALDSGLKVEGPFSADSFFLPGHYDHYDATLAMYHDQGLIPVKCLAFGKAVNVTLGLPILRTSVDHGCAFDIAGTGRADPGSMFEALKLAGDLMRRRGSC